MILQVKFLNTNATMHYLWSNEVCLFSLMKILFIAYFLTQQTAHLQLLRQIYICVLFDHYVIFPQLGDLEDTESLTKPFN